MGKTNDRSRTRPLIYRGVFAVHFDNRELVDARVRNFRIYHDFVLIRNGEEAPIEGPMR